MGRSREMRAPLRFSGPREVGVHTPRTRGLVYFLFGVTGICVFLPSEGDKRFPSIEKSSFVFQVID